MKGRLRYALWATAKGVLVVALLVAVAWFTYFSILHTGAGAP